MKEYWYPYAGHPDGEADIRGARATALTEVRSREGA
jgi:hypothetical protein